MEQNKKYQNKIKATINMMLSFVMSEIEICNLEYYNKKRNKLEAR